MHSASDSCCQRKEIGQVILRQSLKQGRRPHWTFRGLLNVHTRYGLSARCIATAMHLSRRLRRFRYLHRRPDSYRLERPSCQVGIAPTEDPTPFHGAHQLYAHPFEWTWTNQKMRQWFAKHAP